MTGTSPRLPAPGALVALAEDAVVLDLLGSRGWNRVLIPVGEGYRIGAVEFDYEVHLLVVAGKAGQATYSPAHRHPLVDRIHRWAHRTRPARIRGVGGSAC